MDTKVNSITVNGVEYVRADAVSETKYNGNRYVVVVDRGWIFAGDLTEENGRIKLDRAVHVRSWETIGFDGMITDPKNSKVMLRKLGHTVNFPVGAELFRVLVFESWGL